MQSTHACDVHLRTLQEIFGDKVPVSVLTESLQATQGNLEHAIDIISQHLSAQAPTPQKKPDLVEVEVPQKKVEPVVPSPPAVQPTVQSFPSQKKDVMTVDDEVLQGILYFRRNSQTFLVSSIISNRVFLPWSQHDLMHQQFYFESVFKDPDGLLSLNKAQNERFGGWKRPHQIFGNDLSFLCFFCLVRFLRLVSLSFILSVFLC